MFHQRLSNDYTSDPLFAQINAAFQFKQLDDYADDFGHIIQQPPHAVFLPTSVCELQLFLQLASKYQISMVCRARGNSAYGQTQLEDGIIVDLGKLDTAMQLAADGQSVTVPASKTWQDVIELTLQHGMTVPVTIDNLDLTVGGTLSFGALAGTSYRVGSGADNVISLDVVTMDGKRQTCSRAENRELFDAMLCGMGQFGFIITATIPLVAAKPNVQLHLLSYNNVDDFLREQKQLFNSKVFDHLKGFIHKVDGRWEYVIEAAHYQDPTVISSVNEQLSQLKPQKHALQEMAYTDFINMVTNLVTALRASGALNAPHPWYNVLAPESIIAEHLSAVIDTDLLTGAEPVITYPMNSALFAQPLFIKPDAETFYLVGVLYNTSFEARQDYPVDKALQRNRELYTIAHAKGATRYPVDAIPFTQLDWVNHFGDKWQLLCELKAKYDPQHLLHSGTLKFSQPEKAPGYII